ncbi:MAG: hypothetical protein HY699_21145 [Deltaproteobacteria bacterium]|nr:hypothetical protein [Deltaproteobacteria bacterium]
MEASDEAFGRAVKDLVPTYVDMAHGKGKIYLKPPGAQLVEREGLASAALVTKVKREREELLAAVDKITEQKALKPAPRDQLVEVTSELHWERYVGDLPYFRPKLEIIPGVIRYRV